MSDTHDINTLRIKIASPEQILDWSYGEVKKPETINYRSLRPERDGLFCERIFGTTRDWECWCGKFKSKRYKGTICERCGVEVTEKKVRRERCGHINLATPVAHVWFYKSQPSIMSYLLEMKKADFNSIFKYESYVVIDPGQVDGLVKGQVLSEPDYDELIVKYGEDSFKAGMGAEAIYELLKGLDLVELRDRNKKNLEEIIRKSGKTDSGEAKKAASVIKYCSWFLDSGNRPEWMILTVLPVIPPDLRPMVQLDGGRFATTDLNELYRRVINRNNRLQRLISIQAPDIIVRNEKRMLQEAVDCLLDNGKVENPAKGASKRDLKSLADQLKGKQGRFRQNLLGKRVDYSGRSVIVVGPELKMHQCGVPSLMALELFKPFLIRRLHDNGTAPNVKKAKAMVEEGAPEVWSILDDVVKEHPVMLNRAPTLHRLGFQAFEPVLVDGKALKLHPLVCHAFNADFDGDQMAIHLPLSVEAQAECRFLLLSPNNLLKPSDGGPVAVPSQDMVLGIYYLTMHRERDFLNDPDYEGDSVEELKEKGLYFEPLKNKKGEIELVTINDANGNPVQVKMINEDGVEVKVDKTEPVKDGKQMLKEAYDAYQKALADAVKKGKDISTIDLPALNADTIVAVNIDHTRNRIIICRVADILGRYYSSMNQALLAYENGEITLHQDINVKVTKNTADGEVSGIISTTLGRLIFNEIIPQDLGFVERNKDDIDSLLKLEVDKHVGKKGLKQILQKVINTHGATKTAEVLDDIKAMGYKYSTRAAMTVSVSDMTVPAKKAEMLDKAQERVDKITKDYRRGIITEEERYKSVVRTWENADEQLKNLLIDGLDKYNNLFMMADSGARGSNQQIKQLAGMRGCMADTMGRTIELPIKSNFREGLDVLEYFISAHGARKGLSDTALRTADSGYLTRRLVDVSQELVIREMDCSENRATIPGMEVEGFSAGKEVIESISDRLLGRYAAEDIVDEAGNVLVEANHLITPRRVDNIVKAGIKKAKIRTILTCKCKNGICSKCYGSNLATGEAVQVGEAVGIIAAQSIGEPGTQLTMRNFHSGGIAGGDDITQGLPRVEELFEARKPKRVAILSEIDGLAQIKETKKKREVVVTNEETGEIRTYPIPFNSRIMIDDIDGKGQMVKTGDVITDGSVDPHDLLRIQGVRSVQDYILREVQSAYRLQGVELNDKHIEVIVRQMLKKVRVEEAGDTDFLPGTMVDALELEEVNERLESEGKKPAEITKEILGISKAALATSSFLSAASFQETTKVLTEAAIKGKVDPLIGLKENVIIGKLIPAGTGMKRYQNVVLDTSEADTTDVADALEDAYEEAEVSAEITEE